ncbi:hypothetical protein H8356DRAFT_1356556 [Neocallimastix lanati (nom. inval.)]|nr:hypothetical protein H8356DRAFT_1356556 [Neocallimastix sp. JGI-2020a]
MAKGKEKFYKEVKRGKGFFLNKWVTPEMKQTDTKAKYYLHNSIQEELNAKLDYKNLTTYEILKIIIDINEKNPLAKLFLKKKVYLYLSLPNVIISETGLIYYQKKWNDATKTQTIKTKYTETLITDFNSDDEAKALLVNDKEITCWTTDLVTTCHMTNSIKGIKDIVKYNEVIQISNSSTISNIQPWFNGKLPYTFLNASATNKDEFSGNHRYFKGFLAKMNLIFMLNPERFADDLIKITKPSYIIARMKQSTQYHHIRDLVRENKIGLKYIKSQDNLADEIQELDSPLSFKNIFNRPDEKEWLKARDIKRNMVKYIKAEVDKHLYMEVPDGFENLAGFLKIKKKAINDLKQHVINILKSKNLSYYVTSNIFNEAHKNNENFGEIDKNSSKVVAIIIKGSKVVNLYLFEDIKVAKPLEVVEEMEKQ